MLNKLLVSLLFITCVNLSFFLGIYYGEKNFEPQVVYVEVEKIVNTATYERVEVEVIKEVEVEKPVMLREPYSLKELKEWLAEDWTSAVHYVFDWGEPWRPNPKFQDCDDYAYALQQAAMKDGYLMNIQIDTRREHALNSVFIGNKVYFIEPQTDKVWFECYRDKP